MALRVKVQTTLSLSREFGKRPQLAVSLRKVADLCVSEGMYTHLYNNCEQYSALWKLKACIIVITIIGCISRREPTATGKCRIQLRMDKN